MKNKTISLLLIVALFSVSCSDWGSETEVKSVTFMAQDGREIEIHLSDSRSYTSGGNTLSRGFKELTMKEKNGVYILQTEDTDFYIPNTYVLEVRKQK